MSQELADLDYDNLSFRGVGIEWGKLYPTRVDRTESYGIRIDLGYLGPGLRIVPGVTYWSSPLTTREMVKLEERVATLVQSQTGGPRPAVDLGVIEWTDVSISRWAGCLGGSTRFLDFRWTRRCNTCAQWGGRID